MSTDILPRVDSPQISIVWTYTGLNAAEMASKLTSFSEIAIMNNVDDLVEVRSETSNGVGLVKLTFQPYVDMNTALSQATGVSQTILRRMPQGTTPPLIVRTSPSSVPIVQLVMSSDTMSSGQLFDYARLTLRTQLQSVPGMRISLPYGGAARQVMVDLDPEALHAFDMSASEVSAVVSQQNLTLPSGSLARRRPRVAGGDQREPGECPGFLDMPLRSVDGRTVLLRDVANVRDGEAVIYEHRAPRRPERRDDLDPETGQRLDRRHHRRHPGASPGDPRLRPSGMNIEPIFDQSVFVRAAVKGVEHEILLVGGLVATWSCSSSAPGVRR